MSFERDGQIYSSRIAYEAPNDELNGILRVCTYHSTNLDQAIILFPPRENETVEVSLKSNFRDPTMTLGQLDKLPLELIYDICLQTDLKSLFALRQTNLRGRHMIGSIAEYKTVTTHSLHCLNALFATNNAQTVILIDFLRLLYECRCSICAERYGYFAYLPTWIRLCWRCLYDYEPVRVLADAAFKYHLKRLEDSTIILESHPVNTKSSFCRMKNALTDFVLSYHRKKKMVKLKSDNQRSKKPLNIPCQFKACCMFPIYDPITDRTQCGLSCAGCRVAVEDGSNGSIGMREHNIADTVYTEAQYLNHFRWCAHAQTVWRSSEGGKIESYGLPQACKKGLSFKKPLPSKKSLLLKKRNLFSLSKRKLQRR